MFITGLGLGQLVFLLVRGLARSGFKSL